MMMMRRSPRDGLARQPSEKEAAKEHCLPPACRQGLTHANLQSTSNVIWSLSKFIRLVQLLKPSTEAVVHQIRSPRKVFELL